MKTLLLLPIVLFAAACGGKTVDPPIIKSNEHPSVIEARRTLPTALELHATVINRSCSPTGGVCHNGKEYPDLRTVGSMISALSKPCNRDRFDEPAAMFDGCEPAADELVVGEGANEWRTLLGYLGPEEYDMVTFTSFRHLKTAEDAPRRLDRTPARIVRNGETLVTLPANLLIEAGTKEGRIIDTFNLEYASIRALGYVQGGDPNSNGVFGAAQPWELVAPGHPDRSYLIGRITGTVPGSRMPLANLPLTDAEYVAIICWIETVGPEPGPHDAIDYNDCAFAKNPTHYSLR